MKTSLIYFITSFFCIISLANNTNDNSYKKIQELIRNDSAQILAHHTQPGDQVGPYYRFFGYCVKPVLYYHNLLNQLDDSDDSQQFKNKYNECVNFINHTKDETPDYKKYIAPILLFPGFEPLEDFDIGTNQVITFLFDAMKSIERKDILVKNDGKVSLSIISDDIIKNFKLAGASFTEQYGPDFGSISGYHISILDTFELKQIDSVSFLNELESIIKPLHLSDFSIKTAVSQDFPPYKRFFILKFQSNELNNLRSKYGLKPITTHITIFRESRANIKDDTIPSRYELK